MSATRRSRLTKVRMRTPLTLVATTAAIALGMASTASAVGPGGWDHLGAGVTPSSPSLNGDALVLNTDLPGQLLVGGKFTNAGGIADADRIASWNGTAWSAISPTALNGDVMAIETAGGFIFAGGIFTNAGGDPNADFLARWNGATWQPFCTPAVPGPSINGTVTSLQAIGGTLYVGGEFLNGAGNANADFLLACDLASGASSDTVATQAFSGPVYALTADSNGRLYAAGNFINLDSNSASDTSPGSRVGFGPTSEPVPAPADWFRESSARSPRTAPTCTSAPTRPTSPRSPRPITSPAGTARRGMRSEPMSPEPTATCRRAPRSSA